MILSLKRLSPVSDGVHRVKVTNITETKDVPTKYGVKDRIDFSFLLINEKGENEFTCSMYWSSHEESSYALFVKYTLSNFGWSAQQGIETDELVGKTVNAKFHTYRNKNGDEKPSLEWLAPYNNTMEVNSND